MGARSNIAIQDGEDRVWLDGHWMSCQSVEHAAKGSAAIGTTTRRTSPDRSS